MGVKKRIFIFFFSLACCILYNSVNRYFVEKNNPANEQINGRSTVYGSTIWSIDNFWYLTQSKNFLEGKGFLLDPENNFTAVRRTPGYPVFYLIHLVIFGEKYAHKIIPYTQAVLFGLSALALALAVFYFTANKKIAFVSGLIYGSNPFTIGWVYYTITEAIHPAFIIFGFYFFSKAIQRSSVKNWVLTGLFFSISTLIRPLNGLLLPASIVAILFLPGVVFLDKIKRATILASGFFLLILPWTIRNYIITKGDFVVLEKFYHEDPMYMGKKQTYLSRWWMCWGNPRQEIFIDSLKNELITGRDEFINKYVNDMPAYAFKGYSKEELSATLHEYKTCLKLEIDQGIYGKYYKPGESLPSCEEEIKQEFSVLIKKYKNEAVARYYIVSPIFIRGKEFFLTSFASMYGSLKSNTGMFSVTQKVIKVIMFAFNIGLYLSFFAFMLFTKTNRVFKIFIFGFVLSTFLFVVYNVHIEARYMLAAYPFLIISAAMFITSVAEQLKGKVTGNLNTPAIQ